MKFVLSTSKSFSFVLLVFLVVYCSIEYRSDAQPLLPLEEVQTLKTISTKLQNKYWNVRQTSCSQSLDFKGISSNFGYILSNVTCDCSFNNNTVCHVTNIQLKALNLTGALPDEFGDLTYLQEIDLTLNYIYGPIPTSLARLPHLVILSLLGNHVNGTIPEEIGEIATLEELVLEDNQLSGPLPEKLGNLSRLRRLVLSANNFTGTIPETFGKLTNLTAFGIDGSSLSGKIPDFIGNWTKITRLDLQGTSMEGPIPSTISQLTKLEQLRITDLSGSSSMDFPDLQDMKNLQRLELRNCLITGQIPEYIGNFSHMKQLDLSFNRFTGPIPPTASNLVSTINYLFLTNNSLSEDVPTWILGSKQNFDVSYNNFSGSYPNGCPTSAANLVSSYASLGSDSIGWCLKDLPCPSTPQYHSLFINCGGRKVNFEGNEYEDDSTTPGGPSIFYASGTKWAYSSTGLYMDKGNANYIATNTLSLNITGADYYKTARLAPMSLKYYGLCLQKGNYKVQLHFAEILYTDDQTYSSLGKRIFDISIQGNKVLKDFNIVEEAKGVGKGITKTFPSVDVDNNTLEIHLYWSGKGTTSIPDRGVYGPLISAITVTPNFDVGTGLSVGPIVGIVAASCVVLVLILLVLRRKGFLGGKKLEDIELRGLDLQTGYFTLRQLKAATNNFDPENKIGEGGFGPVYKGVLSDGAIIAVKQLSSKSKQGNREFVNEIGMISALQHPNLVRLYGCCVEGNQLLLVYEYMENNSLAHSLFGRGGLNLDWTTRKKICLGIARGLAYIHEESRLKIVHRDIKATNVLLDKDLNAKISDFGLAKLDEGENSHISTRIAGTIGYMAPEYAMRGYLTDKADVYSFGVVMLEIVSGKSNNTNYRAKEEFVYLLDMAYVLQEQGDLLDLVDPSLSSNYDKEEATRMLNLALSCTISSPTLRPSMSSMVSMLESKSAIQVPKIQRSSTNRTMRLKDFEDLSQDSRTQASTFSQDSWVQKSMPVDGPWIDSSLSLPSMAERREHSSSTNYSGSL